MHKADALIAIGLSFIIVAGSVFLIQQAFKPDGIFSSETVRICGSKEATGVTWTPVPDHTCVSEVDFICNGKKVATCTLEVF